MNVYSKRGVRHSMVGGTGLHDGWTGCGKWTRGMFAGCLGGISTADCKRCFRDVTNGG